MSVFDRFVPEEVNRVAQKDIAKDTPGATGSDNAQHSIACAAEVARREDSNVLNENRHFRGGECEVVNPEAGPKHLRAELASHSVFVNMSKNVVCSMERTQT